MRGALEVATPILAVGAWVWALVVVWAALAGAFGLVGLLIGWAPALMAGAVVALVVSCIGLSLAEVMP